MNQSLVTQETAVTLIARAETVISRQLSDMEKALVEYVLDQVRLGLVDEELS